MMTKVSLLAFLAVLATTAMAGPESDHDHNVASLASSGGVVDLDSHILGQESNSDMNAHNLRKLKAKCWTGDTGSAGNPNPALVTFCKKNKCCKHSDLFDLSDLTACSSGTMTVCANSCNGANACADMGNGIVIKSGACVGDDSCYNMRNAVGGTITINEGACKGDSACFPMGNRELTKISIGAGACKGTNACANVGEDEATEIKIAKKACQGDDKCSGCDSLDNSALSITKTCPTI